VRCVVNAQRPVSCSIGPVTYAVDWVAHTYRRRGLIV